MKVCIFGAGAIGGHVAGRLAKGGAEVSVVARGSQLAAIKAKGLRIMTPTEEFEVQVAASNKPNDLGPQDMVIVAVKAPALPAVASNIGPLLGADTSVAFLMNGIPWWYFHAHGGAQDGSPIPLLDPGAQLQTAIGLDRVIGGVVYSACTVTEPGVIHVENPTNRLVLGEPNNTFSPRIEAVAAILRKGGLAIDTSDQIRDVVWSKLLLNLGSGLLGVLSGSAPKDFYLEQACQGATRQIIAEASQIATAMGCTVSSNADAQIRNGSKSGHKTSILQDLELGRPMEIDALYTVPLQLARTFGVSTPVLDLLVALVRTRATAAGLYRPAAT